ncbi:hypothetical protein BDZ45DRAFT_774688 [Acephala macrosclerotiorum]|nr:hypothetical protein BDZ45DRAFT_774688 [Acephala macrosclerotiorum]
MAFNWPPSTAPSCALHYEHMATEPFEADQLETAPAPSQSSSLNMGFDRAGARTLFSNEGNPFLAPCNFYPIEDQPPAFDPAIFNKPFNGRFLCNVPGCPKTFTRKADRDRHVQSWHNCATLHFCPILGCKKSLGKPYSRKDKLQEHMRKKHPAQPQA